MAKLRFLPEWVREQDGDIRCGEELVIEYDPIRLPARKNRRKSTVSANIIFHPSRAMLREPVTPDHAEISVPSGVTAIELWFDRTDSAGETSYDSRFGENYWLPVAPAVDSSPPGDDHPEVPTPAPTPPITPTGTIPAPRTPTRQTVAKPAPPRSARARSRK